MAFFPVTTTFQAETETFSHGDQTRSRVTAVRGFLGEKVQRGYNYALSALHPGGALRDAKIPNTEAGHLIPLELGGADSPFNLVPMYGAVNRGTYRAAERLIASKIVSGKTAAILVRCTYSPFEPEQRAPAYMEIYMSIGCADLTQMPETTTNVRR